jgi:hypothetical protein
MDPSDIPGFDTQKTNLEVEIIEDLLSAEIARNPNISDIFYYFEALTDLKSGRTVGRKIGVVQEIVLRKYIEQSDELARRLYLEQKLEGASGATHKVEFSWYAIAPVTVSAGDIIGRSGVTLERIDLEKQAVRLRTPAGRATTVRMDSPTITSGALRKHLGQSQLDLRLRSVDAQNASFDVVDRSKLLASLESKRVGAQRFSGSDNLGSGIQTIEKAKQASLVAIDLDLKVNGTVKPLQQRGAQKNLLSFVALGNGVHWTAKDKAVLGTYVDFTFLVPDQSIIRYAEYVKNKAPDNSDIMAHFMEYFNGMTIQTEDDFQVTDNDFSIIVPTEETRTLKRILEEHCTRMNPL